MITIEWNRICNDGNGNQLWVCNFLDLEPTHDHTKTLPERYETVLAAARKLGGRPYLKTQFGGGVVFRAHQCQLADIAQRVRAHLQ